MNMPFQVNSAENKQPLFRTMSLHRQSIPIAAACIECRAQPVFYWTPKRNFVLGCCSNGACKTRRNLKSVAGDSLAQAINHWNDDRGIFA